MRKSDIFVCPPAMRKFPTVAVVPLIIGKSEADFF